jgi:hypothetical protein
MDERTQALTGTSKRTSDMVRRFTGTGYLRQEGDIG